jgi:hypothetical protein
MSHMKTIRYVISCLSSEDKSWLRVDNTEGWLEKEGSMCEIPLFLSTARMGIFCAYLWIDNLANPVDRKCVRVSMEVRTLHHTCHVQLGLGPSDHACLTLFERVCCTLKHGYVTVI